MKELPNGFITTNKCDTRHPVIQVGDLIGLLLESYGKEL